MDASPAFMEHRLVKKDRGLKPEDQRLFGTERRSVKKHAVVDVFSEKEGSPCGYPVVRGFKKNWGRVVVVVVKVRQRQFLLR